MAKRLTEEEKARRAAVIAETMRKGNEEALIRFKAHGVKQVEIIGKPGEVFGPFDINTVRACVGVECYAAVVPR